MYMYLASFLHCEWFIFTDVKWSRSYPERSLNFTASSHWMKATILSEDKGSKCSKKCEHFCTLHTPKQTLPQWVDEQRGVDIQFLLAVCLWDLHTFWRRKRNAIKIHTNKCHMNKNQVIQRINITVDKKTINMLTMNTSAWQIHVSVSGNKVKWSLTYNVLPREPLSYKAFSIGRWDG